MPPNMVTLADKNTTAPGIELGSQIAMTFTIPDVDDAMYGKATGLTGEFPLFTRYGSYPTPNYFLKDKADADRILSFYVARARPLFEDLEDDMLRAVVENYLILATYLLPTADVEGPAIRLLFDINAVAFYTDDIVDDVADISELNITSQSIYKRGPSWAKLFAGEYEEFTKFGLYYPAVAKGWDYFVEGCKEADAGIPDFRSKIHYSMKTLLDGMASTPLLIGLQRPAGRHSEQSLKLIRGYQAGGQIALEFALDVNGAQLSEYARSTLPFRILMDNFNVVSGLLNDVLGLTKDVKNQTTMDTVVLRKVINHGVPLQESFRQAMESITDGMHDMKVSLDLLQETFPEDEQVPKFTEIFKHYMDGQLYAYKAWSKVRYGNITLELKGA